MIHKFFGLILEDKKKFVFPKREGLFAYYITNLSSEGSNISVFGVSKKGKFRLATLNKKQDNFKTKLIINENNIETIYAIGDADSRVYITGYELSSKSDTDADTKFHDEFRALQPRAERSVDSDEFEMMTKAQKKQYKQNNKALKQ